MWERDSEDGVDAGLGIGIGALVPGFRGLDFG